MHRFNNGRGALTCDRCCIMLTEGARTLRPYVTVEPSPGTTDVSEEHYCSPACAAREDEEDEDPSAPAC